MKIALVSLNLQWQAGGTRLLFELARGLIEAGNSVVIYAPEINPDAYKELQEGLDIRRVDCGVKIDWTGNPSGIWGSIRRKAHEEFRRRSICMKIADAMEKDFDVINVHDFAYPVGFFYKKKNRSDTLIIWNENDPPFMYLPKKNLALDFFSRVYNLFKKWVDAKFIKSVNHAIVLDEYNKKWCENVGIKASIVRSGLDIKKYEANPKVIPAGIKNIKLLVVGALNPYRRFEDLITAAEILTIRGWEVWVDIVCKDIWNSSEYRKKLSELLIEKNLSDRVNLFFDGVSEAELPIFYQRAHAYVMTSHIPAPRSGFGWGLANFEAMAAGLPLIVSKACTATEVLRDGESAVFFEPCSPQSVADAVEKLFSSPNFYNLIARNGQAYVLKNLTWRQYVDRMIKIIDSVNI